MSVVTQWLEYNKNNVDTPAFGDFKQALTRQHEHSKQRVTLVVTQWKTQVLRTALNTLTLVLVMFFRLLLAMSSGGSMVLKP